MNVDIAKIKVGVGLVQFFVKLLINLVAHIDEGIVAFGEQDKPVLLASEYELVVVTVGDVFDVWGQEPVVVISVG